MSDDASNGAQDFEVQIETPAPAADQATPPLVLLAAAAVAEMNGHAAAETNHEIGGIMVGRVLEGPRPVILVEAAIRGTGMTHSSGSVTFTHETWDGINRIKDEQYPEHKIVGWYHSHPGFGLFLSGHDLFIHRNFFTAPWQIAFVTDPLARTWGCFVWAGADLVQDPGCCVFGAPAGEGAPALEAAVAAPAPLAAPAEPAWSPTPAPPRRDLGLLVALWVVAGMIALVAALSLQNWQTLHRVNQRLSGLLNQPHHETASPAPAVTPPVTPDRAAPAPQASPAGAGEDRAKTAEPDRTPPVSKETGDRGRPGSGGD